MKTFACDECSERVDTKPMLEAHKRNAHEKRAKRHYCHCGLSYENKSNLRRHERETHERHAPAVCNQCGKSYPRKTRYGCEGQKRRREALPLPIHNSRGCAGVLRGREQGGRALERRVGDAPATAHALPSCGPQ